MTKKQKAKNKREWIKAVRPHIQNYFLSETIEDVVNYLQAPVLGVKYGAYPQEYSREIASRIQGIRNDLRELQAKVIKEEQKDWSNLTD